jgi:hypothetical protein
MDDEKLLEQSIDQMNKVDASKAIDYSKMKIFIKFYAVPILSAAIFFGIIFFAVIPTIKGMFSTLDEVDKLKSEDKALQTRIEKLTALENENVLRKDLINTINFLIPTGNSEVVKFRDRVAKATIQQNLILQSDLIGEQILENTSAEKNSSIVGFNLIQIPTEFDITGKFFNFRSFLDKLYVGQDFFIVNEMKVSSAPTPENPENWSGSFTLTKYQFFADEKFSGSEKFILISEDQSPDQVVIQFLEDNFLKEAAAQEE